MPTDRRLLGEDEFFNPTDLGFVTQPVAPVAPVTPASLPGPGLYEGFTPEALAYVTRPGAFERRVGDVRDVIADDFQLYKQLGQTGDTWGGKTTTYQAYDPYGGAGEIFDVKESGLKEGLQTFGEMAAPLVLTAGAGTALGSALGLTGQTATSVGNALISGLVTGDPTKALTAGLGSIATPYLSQLGSAASEALGGGMAGDIASRAITGAGTSALGAAVRGGDIGEALLAGGLGGATGAATSGLVGELGLPEPVGRVATTALTSALRGGDVGKAVGNAVLGEILRAGQTGDRPAGPSELSKTSFLDPAEILGEPLTVGMTDIDLIESILGPQLAGESELGKTRFLDEAAIAEEPLVVGMTDIDLVEAILGPQLAGESELGATKFLDEDKIVSGESALGADLEDALAGPSELSRTKFLDEDVIAREEPVVIGPTDEELAKTILGEDKTTAPAPAPKVSAPAPAPAPAPKPSSFDPDLLMLLGALMTPQERERDMQQAANVAPGVQAGLKAIEQMYGTRRG